VEAIFIHTYIYRDFIKISPDGTVHEISYHCRLLYLWRRID
jgi:hypothetical protein